MKIYHLDEGELQALLDGELPQQQSAVALHHIESCRACAEAYDELRRASAVLTSALSMLDGGAERARALMPPPTMISRRRHWGGASLAKAAALLVTLGAVSSATIPGSPVRGWFADRYGPSSAVVAIDQREVGDPQTATLALEAAPAETGVAVEPANGRLRVVLTGPDPDLPIRAMLTDSPRGGAFLVGDTASAEFDSSLGRVDVIDAKGGLLRIEIPRSASAATVEIDGRVYVVSEGDRLRVTEPPTEITGTDVEFRIRR